VDERVVDERKNRLMLQGGELCVYVITWWILFQKDDATESSNPSQANEVIHDLELFQAQRRMVSWSSGIGLIFTTGTTFKCNV
jgi:hypothetical protein